MSVLSFNFVTLTVLEKSDENLSDNWTVGMTEGLTEGQGKSSIAPFFLKLGYN